MDRDSVHEVARVALEEESRQSLDYPQTKNSLPSNFAHGVPLEGPLSQNKDTDAKGDTCGPKDPACGHEHEEPLNDKSRSSGCESRDIPDLHIPSASENATGPVEEHAEDESSLTKKRKLRKKQQSERKITSVYVTGLPIDITIDELNEHFKTCGIILPNLETGLPRIKIYEDQNGQPKGDALVIYLKEESVLLAEKLLDESMIRPGVKIRVQKATFSSGKKTSESTADLNPELKKKLRNIHKKLEWY